MLIKSSENRQICHNYSRNAENYFLFVSVTNISGHNKENKHILKQIENL